LPPTEDAAPADAARPPRAATVALRAVQAGAILVILAVVPNSEFELDRFYVPKELVLHATAAVAWIALLRLPSLPRRRHLPERVTDLLLAGFLLLGALSAVLAANVWLGFRAFALSASALALSWAARRLAAAGLQKPVVAALAVAVVVGVATALLQAYGFSSDLFSPSRAPGGTLGNRNSVAHLAALGLPLVLLCALWAQRWWGYLLAAAGTMLVVVGLVLTRSRAAWLAAGAVLLVLALAFLLSPVLRRSRPVLLRLAGLLLVAAAGVFAAITLPNALQWRSDSPYLDSLRGVAQFQEGSGAGRLIQYRQSLEMAMAAPLLGVGPANWPVEYPAHAARRDPSMSGRHPGMTSNPWPSSDWVAFLSERGFLATLLLGAALVWLAFAALRRLRQHPVDGDVATPGDPGDATVAALTAVAASGVITGALVTGLFDAVLLLPHAAFIAWAGLGALQPLPEGVGPSQLATSSGDPTQPRRYAHAARRAGAAALLLIAAAGTLRSAGQLAALQIFEHRADARGLRAAAMLDPGNYRLRLRLARPESGLPREERCRHARAAHEQFPHAQQARTLHRRCV
jgi:O-antigen ligase